MALTMKLWANSSTCRQDHVVTMMTAIGKATNEAWPRGGQLPMNEVVINNHF